MNRTLLVVMAFGVVLFTLLVQGTTMNLLLRRLGLVEREPTILEYQRQHGRLAAAQAALSRIEELQQEGTFSTATSGSLLAVLQQEIEDARDAEHNLLNKHPALQAEVTNNARHEGLLAKRATLTTLANDGVISELIYQELLSQVDAELEVKLETDPNR